MRPAFATLALLALLPFAGHASAQPEGCLQSSPCSWDVDVDAKGIASISESNFTSGDWYVLSVYNDDGAPHTLGLSGHALTVQVPAHGLVDSPPFQFGKAGGYTLSDTPSGDSAPITVVAGDVVDYESGQTSSTSSPKGHIPGPEPALLLLGLAGLALLRRR